MAKIFYLINIKLHFTISEYQLSRFEMFIFITSETPLFWGIFREKCWFPQFVWWYLYKYDQVERYKRTAYLFNIHISLIQSIIKIVFEPDCFWHILFLERPILSLTPSRQQPLNVWGFDQFLIEIILLTLTWQVNLSQSVCSHFIIFFKHQKPI